jgi:uncharacterized membrane protein YgcG
MTKVTRRFLALLLAALAFALPAIAREMRIQNFESLVTVNPNGTIDVSETITANFSGEWHGIYRTIPIEYSTSQGLNYTLFLSDVIATDDSGNRLKLEISRQGPNEQFKIYIPDAVNATRTVVLHYHVLDGLRFFPDHDELYWNVTGNSWDVPLQAASAEIDLPAGVTGIRTLAFTGAYGSNSQDADVQVNASQIRVKSRHSLRFHEGLTAVIGWDKGLVHEPTALDLFFLYLRSNWVLILPFLAFGIMFWLWWTRGRDPRRQPISVQYEPPDQLTPGEVGTLVDNSANMRDITATIVDLAVKGYYVIEQAERDQMLGLLHSKEYIFHLKKPATEWQSARPHELEMLTALFDGGARDTVKMSELQNHFYVHLPRIRDNLFDALVTDGYYLHRPDRVRAAYIVGGVVLAIFLAVVGANISGAMGIAPLSAIIAGVASGIIVCAFGWFMPARTVTGARTLEKVLGFEDFLGRVEGDRLDRIVKTPELFEKFLPYAMALQVEKKWVQAFSNISMQPPSWYQGPYGGGFYPYLLVNDLNVMSHSAGSAFASAPRSSSGSSGFGGGGGGGFSGGGFGGGGGGGF